MNLRLLPLLLLALPAPLTAQSAPQEEEEERIARVEAGLLPRVRVQGRPVPPATLEARMRELGVPAVTIAVIHDGEVAWAKAYGLADVERGVEATPATLFQAASMSKPVAASAALRLVEEGVLSLDEDVNLRLRSWKIPVDSLSAGNPVTLRRLVSHTAGLTVHGFPGYARGVSVPGAVDVLDGRAPANTAAVRVDIPPGSRVRYSGGGTTVMQVMLEDVTGVPFAALLRERVLAPVGMAASTYDQPLGPAREGEAATAYRRGMQPVPGGHHTYPEMAAAGLWTTPTELARWVIAIQRSAAGEPGALLQRQTAREMLAPVMESVGLGVMLAGAGDSLRFSHGGSNAGFRGEFVGYVEGGQGAVVMTNSDTGGPLVSQVLEAIAREYGWPGFGRAEVVPVPLTPGRAADYVGRYGQDADRVALTVGEAGGVLTVTVAGSDPKELLPTGGDSFLLLPDGVAVEFSRDDAGRVTGMVATGSRLMKLP
jgi:CubicO group peptidase (beta-lactamase class C family)